MAMRSGAQRSLAALGLVAACGLAALVWYRVSVARQIAERARPLPLVQVTTPARVDIERKLLLTADILPLKQADLMAKVAGYLDAIYVDRGDRVHAGQLLAVIHQPDLEQQLQRAQSTYNLSKVTYERLQALYRQELIAKQDLDDARTKLEVAKRDLEVQRTYTDYARIIAPFDGFVTKRYVDPGSLIPQVSSSSSTTNMLLTIMDVSRVKVVINVPERDVGSVHVGDPITLSVDAYADQTFRGQVSRFGPALDRGSRTLQVEIDVDNDDLALKPGMFARVTLVLERRPQVLVVPADALLVNELGTFLYVVNPPEGGAVPGEETPTVRRTAVSTGVEDGGQVEIRAGLGAGSHIVRTGKELVHDGGRVRLAPDGAKPLAAEEH